MQWKSTFLFNNKSIYYNRIRFNNPSERAVEIPIAFGFLASLASKGNILEVGNVLSNYENSLSDYLGIRSRRIVDKFESNTDVDKVDLMDLPSNEKYGVIVSISTVEHIGQGVDPESAYGESTLSRDLEAPLKAISKIYDLLSIGGKALVTVPFGKLIDGGWYIQFSKEYLNLLTQKYAMNQGATSIRFLKEEAMQIVNGSPHQLWKEVKADELIEVEYGWPFGGANGIAVIELTKSTESTSLLLNASLIDLPPTALFYDSPITAKLNIQPNSSEASIDKYNCKNSSSSLLDTDFSKITRKNTIFVVDGIFFQLYKTGIARVWRSLLEEWAANGFAQQLVVLDRAGSSPKFPGIRYRPAPAYDCNRTDADREMLQQVCDEEGADLFISTYYSTPISTPSVFMAYDMIPEVVDADLNTQMWREKHYGIQHASAYIAISENTAHDLVKFFPGISPESITIAHCGVQRTFSPADSQVVSSFKARYGISKPYFVLVGAGSGQKDTYKNTILFFKAFSKLYSRQAFDVVCTGGGLLEDELRTYTSGSTVHMLQLNDEELRAAYSGAVALVYPSKYEGFGLPVLEAIACGCPVITCPNASIPEVAGEAALYVNDEDVDGLANALCNVQKPSVRNSLIAAGLAQAKKFSWSKMASTVSSALIDATLLPLNLKGTNLIVFPDWSQPEDSLSQDLASVIRAVVSHSDKSDMTLLIDTSGISEEDANLSLSAAAMNLLLEEDLDVTDGPEISLLGKLGKVQWEALLPRIHSRISLENENKQAIARVKAETIPSCELDRHF